ncbi:protein FAM227B-like [Rhinoraja longicauda]
MEELPKTFEEFLKFQSVTNWPEMLPDEDEFNMQTQPDILVSYESVSQYVYENAPFRMEFLTDMGQKINEFRSRLGKYSSKILPDEPRKYKNKEHLFYLPSETFISQMQDSDALLTHPSRKLSKQPDRAQRILNVESQPFPGFKSYMFAKLPGQLEAKQLLNWIRKTQISHLGFHATWRKLILSEPSAAIVHDTFWWFFLHKFKPCREDEDHFFSRIADSFVTLFMICPAEALDKLFQVYPDCIAQAVFAAFYKSFPESHNKFGEEFKNELTELITLWMTGIMPREPSWKNWDIQWLESSMSRRGSEREETIRADIDIESTTLRFGYDLDELVPDICRVEKVLPPRKPPPAMIESSYAGRGPEFKQIRLRLSGRSPLVTHFLNMKKVQGRSLGSIGPTLRHSYVSKHPALQPTYLDIIKEAESFSKALKQKNIDVHEQTKKEVAKIKWDQMQFNKRIDRPQLKLTASRGTRICPSRKTGE